MRLNRPAIGIIAACVFPQLWCVGCASRQVEVALKYTPAKTRFLDGLKPAAVSLQVVDQRPEEERNDIGFQRNTVLGAKRAAIVSKTPEVQVVRNAIKTELERSGHHVLDPGTGDAEVALTVTLREFRFDSKATGDTDIELIGSIRADVAASVGTGNGPQVLFTVQAAHHDLVPLGWSLPTVLTGVGGIVWSKTGKGDIEKTLNQTLSVFVEHFFSEPKLRGVIKVAEWRR